MDSQFVSTNIPVHRITSKLEIDDRPNASVTIIHEGTNPKSVREKHIKAINFICNADKEDDVRG